MNDVSTRAARGRRIAASSMAASALALGLLAPACVRMTVQGGDIQGSFGINASQEKLTEERKNDLDLAPGDLLDLETSFGHIEVAASNSPRAQLVTTVTVWAETEEETRRLMDATKVEITKADGTVTARVVTDADAAKVDRSRWSGKAGASFRALVPDGVRAKLVSSSGSITTKGALANSEIRSSFGALAIRGLRGDLAADTSSGSIALQDITAKRIDAKTSFGSIECKELHADDVSCITSSGRVSVSGGGRATYNLRSSFGAINAERASGWVTAVTSSGKIEVEQFDGKVEATTSFGSVSLSGVFREVVARSQSGSMQLHAKPGSRVEAPWVVDTQFGSVTAALPDGIACDIDAETGFGRVNSSLQAEAEDRASKKRLTSKLGGGGPTVTLRSRSGSISLDRARK